MKRRAFLLAGTLAAGVFGVGMLTRFNPVRAAPGGQAAPGAGGANADDTPDWETLSEADWRARLTDKQFYVLREAGTERSFTSPLETEKREGVYHCAGCDLALFDSAAKFDSGTGWPSFWTGRDGALGLSRDYKIGYPRDEYHCIRCKGHQGHVFTDGPKPTGMRWCNNGVALVFRPADGSAPAWG